MPTDSQIFKELEERYVPIYVNGHLIDGLDEMQNSKNKNPSTREQTLPVIVPKPQSKLSRNRNRKIASSPLANVKSNNQMYTWKTIALVLVIVQALIVSVYYLTQSFSSDSSVKVSIDTEQAHKWYKSKTKPGVSWKIIDQEKTFIESYNYCLRILKGELIHLNSKAQEEEFRNFLIGAPQNSSYWLGRMFTHSKVDKQSCNYYPDTQSCCTIAIYNNYDYNKPVECRMYKKKAHCEFKTHFVCERHERNGPSDLESFPKNSTDKDLRNSEDIEFSVTGAPTRSTSAVNRPKKPKKSDKSNRAEESENTFKIILNIMP